MSRGEADIQSAASLFAFLYGASLVGAATGFAGRRPRGGRKDGRIGRKQHGFLSDGGGLRIQEKVPHETAAKVSPLRPGSVPESAAQEPHTPDPQPVRVKEHWQLLPICQQLQPSSAAWCSPPPSQMGRAHAPRGIVLTEAKVKRDRFRAAPQNGRRRKAFSPFKGLRSAERKRKRTPLPTGEVRPSEHDNDF